MARLSTLHLSNLEYSQDQLYPNYFFNILLTAYPPSTTPVKRETIPAKTNILPCRTHFFSTSEYLIRPKLTIVYNGTIPSQGIHRYNTSSTILRNLYPGWTTPLAI